MTQNKRKIGAHYETLTADLLEKSGMTVLERNFRCRSGEIDIIAKDGNCLVFVEVKYRRTETAGSALDAIDRKKAARIRRAAAFYLSSRRYPENTLCRFDAAGIDGDRITYIKNAF